MAGLWEGVQGKRSLPGASTPRAWSIGKNRIRTLRGGLASVGPSTEEYSELSDGDPVCSERVLGHSPLESLGMAPVCESYWP